MQESLVPSEGVDEGSAASTAESSADHDERGVLGPAPRGRPERETDPAPSADLETAESDQAPRTGQQLSGGEG